MYKAQDLPLFQKFGHWLFYVGESSKSKKSAISRPLFDLGSCPFGHLLPLVMGLIDQSLIAQNLVQQKLESNNQGLFWYRLRL